VTIAATAGARAGQLFRPLRPRRYRQAWRSRLPPRYRRYPAHAAGPRQGTSRDRSRSGL